MSASMSIKGMRRRLGQVRRAMYIGWAGDSLQNHALAVFTEEMHCLNVEAMSCAAKAIDEVLRGR